MSGLADLLPGPQQVEIDGKCLAINFNLLRTWQQISQPAHPVTCWKSTVPCEIV